MRLRESRFQILGHVQCSHTVSRREAGPSCWRGQIVEGAWKGVRWGLVEAVEGFQEDGPVEDATERLSGDAGKSGGKVTQRQHYPG
jgi:hypothetical protein